MPHGPTENPLLKDTRQASTAKTLRWPAMSDCTNATKWSSPTLFPTLDFVKVFTKDTSGQGACLLGHASVYVHYPETT